MEAPPVQYVRTIDGCTLAYSVSGTGPPLLRTPGAWGSIPLAAGLLRAEYASFEQHFTVTTYDSRGQGLSSRGLPVTPSADDLVSDLDCIVQQTQTKPFVLYGHGDYTAAIAIRYAAIHPDRIQALVLQNFVDAKLAGYAEPLRVLAATDWESFVNTIARTSFPRLDASAVKLVMQGSVTQSELNTLNSVLRAESVAGLLTEIRVPTLVLAARQGTAALRHEEGARWLASNIPGAQLLLFNGREPVGDDNVPLALHAIQSFISKVQTPATSSRGQLGQDHLSSREREVLRLIAAGRSNAQIADELVISPNTVGRHVSNIFGKIGAANRVEASWYAREQGIT
jgi:DNA-binding NarL/FixJ family response regulator